MKWLARFAAAGLVAFCFFGMYMSVHTANEFRRKCAAAGGEPYMPKHGWICLRPGLTVPLR
jgi:hypothetical protein